eukprot:s760_g2.t1
MPKKGKRLELYLKPSQIQFSHDAFGAVFSDGKHSFRDTFLAMHNRMLRPEDVELMYVVEHNGRYVSISNGRLAAYRMYGKKVAERRGFRFDDLESPSFVAHQLDCDMQPVSGPPNPVIQVSISKREPGRARPAREPCKGVWRAPKTYHFVVDCETMLAPEDPEDLGDSDGVVTNHWADGKGSDVGAEGTLFGGDGAAQPRIGRVHGTERQYTLRYMQEAGRSRQTSPMLQEGSRRTTQCARNVAAQPDRRSSCLVTIASTILKPRRTAIDRCYRWEQEVISLIKKRAYTADPLRVVVLEVGAGNNVRTIREYSENLLRDCSRGCPGIRIADIDLGSKDWLKEGADAKLLRVNPDFPLPDHSKLEDDGDLAGHVISMMGRGLQCVQMMDHFMGPASFGRPPVPDSLPPPPPPPPSSAPPSRPSGPPSCAPPPAPSS